MTDDLDPSSSKIEHHRYEFSCLLFNTLRDHYRSEYERKDGWMDGWMDGWVDGWMGGWMDGWVDSAHTHPHNTANV